MTRVPAAVQAIFEKRRDELARRVGTVEEAVAAMLEGALGEDLRAEAERDAHKLAGSLGMFGFPRGSELARELELGARRPQRPGAVRGPTPCPAGVGAPHRAR